MKTNHPARIQNGLVAVALEDLTRACAELARRGCTIVATRTNAAMQRPLITIARPPRGARIERGSKITTHATVTYAGIVAGCQVQWTEPKGA